MLASVTLAKARVHWNVGCATAPGFRLKACPALDTGAGMTRLEGFAFYCQGSDGCSNAPFVSLRGRVS